MCVCCKRLGAGGGGLCSSSVVFRQPQQQNSLKHIEQVEEMLLSRLIAKGLKHLSKKYCKEKAKKCLPSYKEQNDVSWGSILVWSHSCWKKGRGWLFLDHLFGKCHLYSKKIITPSERYPQNADKTGQKTINKDENARTGINHKIHMQWSFKRCLGGETTMQGCRPMSRCLCHFAYNVGSWVSAGLSVHLGF